ncbi:ribonuclease Oy-like [Ornithodoros turicata]|uniref:ribonuclease Oy-like n=1 Tax=Ornithodoros turicata TaxID=34597 RepID=UPI0031391A7C
MVGHQIDRTVFAVLVLVTCIGHDEAVLTRSQQPSSGTGGAQRFNQQRPAQSGRRPPTNIRNNQRHPSNNGSYDYFILSQQWSPGSCATESRCVTGSKRRFWTIHGLWPSGDYASPSYCLDERFDGRVLDPIKGSLNQYWPSLTSTQARFFTFWRHQWQKHGTCAGDVPQLAGLLKFFNTTLAVYRRYNVYEFLSNSNITPSTTRTYSVNNIRNALSDDIREKVNIVCTRSQTLLAPVLTEIRFCLDKTLSLVHCQGRTSGCTSRNYYLPY